MTSNLPPAPPGLKNLSAIKRRTLSVSNEGLVKVRPLFESGDLPLLVEPAVSGLDLASWASGNRDFIEEKLAHHGALLFRNFGVQEAASLEGFIRAVCGEALEYRERSSPRSSVAGNIYTSTDHPPSQPIFLHNENSYQKVWPLKIFFCCHQPSEQGGETPIADCRRVLAHVDPAIRDRFAAKGWMYVRNFGDGFGLTWQTVFQTEDKQQVEEHCRRSGIGVEWKAGDRLRTRAIRPVFSRHPRTGESLWFNHATFFHVSTLDPAVREALLKEFSADDLPANTYYGDGTPIEPAVMEHLRAAYHRETVSFLWERGDLLMVDNMKVAHGRAPFSGSRKILVGMAEPVSRDDVQD